MPLLKKRSFEKASSPEFLRDDEEVFYCEITNEIFRNYEEFAERMLLCTSMVWTCAMTGKSNLTYEEALESEENAKKAIKEFPVELKIPVLYLGTKTKRTGFGEMAEDVFSFCKDRYFIGEKVEASFGGNKWVESQVLQVLAPNDENVKVSSTNGSTVKHSITSPSLYKYEIEHVSADDRDISARMFLDFNQIRRKKMLFNKEKCKLFLKQYVEQDNDGHLVIKPSTIEEFKLDNIKFEKMFNFVAPDFDASKRFERKLDSKKSGAVNGKKVRQETLVKYLTKVNGTAKDNSIVNNTKKNTEFLEQMKKKKEEYEILKEQMKNAKLEEKEKKKKAHLELTNQLKEWLKPKEDLELENQHPFPSFPVVHSKIPNEYIGDVFMLMEFIESFSKTIETKNFFQSGLSLEIMERALIEEEVAGPFIDLIQMLLTALFKEQNEENNEYSMQIAKPTILSNIDIKNMSLEEASRFACLAAKWPKDHQGLSVKNLPLYSLTLTEVLRIHLLSSGAKLLESGEKGRFLQRGGYSFTDDPGLYLRVHKPHILKALAIKNVVQLKMGDKIAILTCLMHQLLTYANYRDTIEDRIEKNRQMKIELKNAQVVEKKRENEYNAAQWHLKKDAKTKKQDNTSLTKSLDDLQQKEKKRKQLSEKELETCIKAAYDKEVFLGMDRAYQKYYKLESLPGVLIETTEDYPGCCLPEPVKQIPELVNAEKTTIMEYFKQVGNKHTSSDKENTPNEISPKKMNGDSSHDIEMIKSGSDYLICSANSKNCIVHSESRNNFKWKFIANAEQVDSLINSLNKRGIRESELAQVLQTNKEILLKFMKQTPVHQLNRNFDDLSSKVATRGKRNYADANLGFPVGTTIEEILQSALTDDILEMEEKIYSGSLGQLFVKNRDEWRNCLLNRDYANFNREIVRRALAENDIKTELEDEEEESVPDLKKKYSDSDPGKFLGPTNIEDDKNDIHQSKETVMAIECLAIALAQVAQAVEFKFLQKPLGNSSNKTLATFVPSRNRLENWEQSLLSSSSFSQIFLHYSNLDSCVMWSRSTLLAKCRICRRQKDSENMLLCDDCNLGHHLYCLKPKLTSIPKGDWYCNKCIAAKEERRVGSEVIPKKKRRLFKEEEVEEEEEEEEVEEEEESLQESEEKSEEENEESDNQSEQEDKEDDSEVKICKTCLSGGDLMACKECSTSYHKECINPPIRKTKSDWVCNECRGIAKEDYEYRHNNNNRSRSKKIESMRLRDRARESSSDSDNYPLAHHVGVNNERRSATKARHNIYNFIKSLRRLSSSDDDSDEEIHTSQRKRSFRRESGRDDLPLHNAALQDLLTEVMKHPDAWPFLRPVQKYEVPDYHDVIRHPMDFGTIKYKLNMGEYNTDSQLMHDAALVFKNCNTYNEMESEISKCGERLLGFFRTKCSDLGLKIPSKEDEKEVNNKRRKK